MSKKKQTIIKPVIKPTKESVALTVSDLIQTCINTDTDFIINHASEKRAVTITAKRDYQKFKTLFSDATIEMNTHAQCFAQLILKYE